MGGHGWGGAGGEITKMKAKKGGRRLIRVHPELGATKYFIQAGHHRTAIEAAVAYVDERFARSAPERTADMLASEFASIEHQWVIETIYQGAYMREYHLWEKDCKEYFLSQGMKPAKRAAFTDHVKGVLSCHFDLVVPEDVMDALSTMRLKVNRMKHEGEVQNDEFVLAADYAAAVTAIERFWQFLEENEQFAISKDAR
jgi:hypothetical protein